MTQIDVLIVGTGEYTTGFVGGAAAKSDKGPGVVALVLFDLRRRGIVRHLRMVGTNGTKFPGIRQHLQTCIGDRYRDLDTSLQSFPADDVPNDPHAYKQAIRCMSPGDAVIIFTPDDKHAPIALEAVQQGCHVLIAKPIVKTVSEHLQLEAQAKQHDVLVAMEVHKRWDPIYQDARDRIGSLGEFSFFQSYMSQPKSQLETFRAWAGKASDISYYLNAHHIDFHAWALQGRARPISVYAAAATGVARDVPTEDTISLMVTWENLPSHHRAAAVYTASWIAPRSDVHSQQNFHYMGHSGEVRIDQAHRGYSVATDQAGYASPNPLFMKYQPDAQGNFAGQQGYGYRCIEDFVLAARAIRAGQAAPHQFQDSLATVQTTQLVTAILEAGRRSLDTAAPQSIRYHDDGSIRPF